MNRRTFLKTASLAAPALVFGVPHRPVRAVAKNDRLQLGVIGTGSRGSGLIHVLGDLPELRVVACADVLPFRLERGLALAGEGCRGHSDYRRVLADPEVDAVIIATPLSMHHEMAVAAIAAGKHVYCEKTMTYEIDEALDLTRRAAAGGRIFQVGYQYRSVPLYHRVAEILREGYLGQVTQISLQWNRNGDWRRPVPDPKYERLINWRMYREYSGGLLAELTSHQLDYVNWIFDSHPLTVTGFGGIDFWRDGRETFDNVHVLFDYPEGLTVSAVCLTANAHQGYRMVFRGSRGTLELGVDKARIYAESTGEEERGIVDGVSGATRAAFERGESVGVSAPSGREGWGGSHYALAELYRSVRDLRQPSSGVVAGARSAISTRLAIDAVRGGRLERWSPEYDRVLAGSPAQAGADEETPAATGRS